MKYADSHTIIPTVLVELVGKIGAKLKPDHYRHSGLEIEEAENIGTCWMVVTTDGSFWEITPGKAARLIDSADANNHDQLRFIENYLDTASPYAFASNVFEVAKRYGIKLTSDHVQQISWGYSRESLARGERFRAQEILFSGDAEQIFELIERLSKPPTFNAIPEIPKRFNPLAWLAGCPLMAALRQRAATLGVTTDDCFDCN